MVVTGMASESPYSPWAQVVTGRAAWLVGDNHRYDISENTLAKFNATVQVGMVVFNLSTLLPLLSPATLSAKTSSWVLYTFNKNLFQGKKNLLEQLNRTGLFLR